MNAPRAGDDLRPQRPGGMGAGALLALLIHVGLVVAIALGVSWRVHEPTGASAELWASVPRSAAPPAQEPPAPAPEPRPAPEPKPAPPPEPKPAPPPEPKPQQREADIAVEKARQERELREQKAREQKAREEKEREQKEREQKERERAEREKQREQREQREAAEKKEQAEEAKRKLAEERAAKQREEALAKQRDENLKRILGQAGGSGAPSSTGTTAQSAGPSASYTGRIIARIKPNIVFTEDPPGNPVAVVEVRAAPDGTILGRRLIKASGHKGWDEAVLRAVDRTNGLPRDTDGRVPSTIIIDFRPRD